MAFESNTAADREDLLDRLRIFASNNGWTVDRNTITTDGRLSIRQSGLAVHFDTTTDTVYSFDSTNLPPIDDDIIVAAPSTSYDSANAANYFDHPDSPVGSFTDNSRAELQRLGTNIDYQFFTGGAGDPFYLYIVIEPIPNQYMHLMFGQIEKAGTYTGGEFLLNTQWDWYRRHAQDYAERTNTSFLTQESSNPSTLFLDDANVSSARALTMSGSNFAAANIVGHAADGVDNSNYLDESLYAHVLAGGQVGPSGITPLFDIPLIINLDDVTPTSDFQYLGKIPNMKLCSLAGRVPKEEVTIGSDTWVLYPFIKKGSVRHRLDVLGGTEGANVWSLEGPSSGEAGFAIKKVI